MPSFVSVDYSFPFEVKLLAQRGMSERQLKGDSHISPRAACHLGGKYVCMERGRERESFIWLSDLTAWSACFSNHKPQFFSHMHLSINAVYILIINKHVFILDVKTKQKPETCKPLSISVWWIFRSVPYWVREIIKCSNWLCFRTQILHQTSDGGFLQYQDYANKALKCINITGNNLHLSN